MVRTVSNIYNNAFVLHLYSHTIYIYLKVKIYVDKDINFFMPENNEG